MIRRPPRSTLFPTRRSSDLGQLGSSAQELAGVQERADEMESELQQRDRKSTRLNSSHSQISYAVFCLKKKKPPAGKKNSMRKYDKSSPIWPANATTPAILTV